MEDEYHVLIRLVGPFFGFVAVMHWIGKTDGIPTPLQVSQWNLRHPPLAFTEQAAKTGRLSVLLPSFAMPYSQNLVSKWIEGLYFSPPFVNDYLSWVHGPFQAIANNQVQTVIPHLLFSTGVEPFETVAETLGEHNPIWRVDITHGIFEIEVTMNAWLLQLMNRLRINQRDWPGKHRQDKLYHSRHNL
eukprot:Unigene3343_Nuclearia_a/m.10260 Unigene3343_Nuclearia_a/g.10260  ORF Unigene3343_Nuclearia_a/g.10260 Unigene3343_Nuclearia_a/m.10260 type:complete len:188 (-) Unigene3343_Nuclearia_a:1662-2225(-)